MPHRNVDWLYIRDPHPSSLPNLQTLADFMMNEGATHSAHTVSIYALAKYLDRQHKQVANLIRDRPGFVLVEQNGIARGYYYDLDNFGMKYPAKYSEFKRRKIPAVVDVQELIGEHSDRAIAAIKEGAQELAAQQRELAKQEPEIVVREVTVEPDYPVIKMHGGNNPDKVVKVIVEFVPEENPEAKLQQALHEIREGKAEGIPPEMHARMFINQAIRANLTNLHFQARLIQEGNSANVQ